MSHLDKTLKIYDINNMVTYCPICFHSIHFERYGVGWFLSLGCCHLRSVVVEDGKYIGKFSYERGTFEGIKEICH